ncbi:MAG: DUF1559 domain-containing protein [Pirellulaceae bacterium]|nr:DUF1559 domain-containing protein [Pirellulaceae bacterium]
MSYAEMPQKPAPSSSSSAATIIIIVLAVGLGFMLVCGGVLVALLLPAISAARDAARRVESMNNLKQIGLALHSYHDTYGRFPASRIDDANGRPQTSWRTALLPFVEQQPMYDQYDFHQAWDSPVNQNLVSVPIKIFMSPRDPNIQGNRTSYLALTGPGTVLEANKFSAMRDIIDGTSNTLIAVEVVGSDVPWAEPRDLNIEDVRMSGQPGDLDPNGFLALFADGSVQHLQGLTLEEFLSLARRDDQSRPDKYGPGAAGEH